MSISDVAIRYALELGDWFEEKFLPKTERDEATGCLLWTGAKAPGGGGVISIVLPSHGGGQRPMLAHRVAFAKEHGVDALPKGGSRPTYVVDRSCGQLLCVEPAHLVKVSAWAVRNRYVQVFNARDRVSG